MMIKPNRTLVKGTIEKIVPAADGWGANLEFTVESSKAAKGFEDFLQPETGATLVVFTAEPENLRVGGNYVVTASVNGGPFGERVVAESTKALD